jgi:hypothetical protein
MTEPAIHDTATRASSEPSDAIADARQNILNAIEAIDLSLHHAAKMHMHKAVRNLAYAGRDSVDTAIYNQDQRSKTIEECAKVVENIDFPTPRKNHRYQYDVKYSIVSAIRALNRSIP